MMVVYEAETDDLPFQHVLILSYKASCRTERIENKAYQ